MKYHTNWLLEQSNPEYLFFWGHRPSRDGSVIKSCLSQWWPANFEENGERFLTAEHYMMVGKARLFQDEEIAQRMFTKTSPKDAKMLGRQVKNFDPEIWDKHKYAIVCKGNWLKFSQNAELSDFLIKTGNKVLVEASPVDRIWGIGMAETDAEILYPQKWRGENLLGFALMEVRDELIKH